MLIWKDLKENLAPYIGDGTCDPIAQAKGLNTAIQRLMQSNQWKSLNTIMRMVVDGTVFPLPYNVETLLSANVDGHPTQIFGTEYQFINGGPGDLDRQHSGGSMSLLETGSRTESLADLGTDHATMFDIPLDYGGYVIAAFCTSAADAGQVIRLRGMDASNQEVHEDLPMIRWDGGIEGEYSGGNWTSCTSVNPYSFLSRVILPETPLAGYFSLYAVNKITDAMYYLGKYHPSARIPTFRRYRFARPLHSEARSLTSPGLYDHRRYATVLAQVKLKFVPYVDDNDVVPIDSELAIENMLRAINVGRTNPQAGAQFAKVAIDLLAEAQASRENYNGFPILIGSNPVTSLGRHTRSSLSGRF